MALLMNHYGCPNPVRWGASPVKTVYVRDTEDGKARWKPVGWICTGCGVFRSIAGSFPVGRIEPVCVPWMPEKDTLESIKEAGDDTDVETKIEVAHLEVVTSEESNKEWPEVEPVPGATPEDEAADVAAMTQDLEHKPTLILQADETHDSPIPAAPGRQPYGSRVRVTVPALQRLLRIGYVEVMNRKKSGEIPVEVDKHRHWSVPRDWHDAMMKEKKLQSLAEGRE